MHGNLWYLEPGHACVSSLRVQADNGGLLDHHVVVDFMVVPRPADCILEQGDKGSGVGAPVGCWCSGEPQADLGTTYFDCFAGCMPLRFDLILCQINV